jgi:endonuclease/exonuclease/phosphatase family metal-dependent hydrolase
MRKESWYLLRFLHAQSMVPWLCAGDFNKVLTEEEHFGVNDREVWQMEAFQDMAVDCGFTDLGFRGLPFTWDNKPKGDRNVKARLDRNVKARLDRAFGDDRFLNALGGTSVEHIQLAKSDHCALLVSVRQQVAPQRVRQRTPKPFRCEDTGGVPEKFGILP